MLTAQEEFLAKATQAASTAGHIWPEYAACEAALESGWGTSKLAVRANNLFGQKQTAPPLYGTGNLVLPTREFLRGEWVEVVARWISFPDWIACFRSRMEMLEREQGEYPAFAAALRATTGEEFVRQVSSKWSTDPERAEKVLEIYGRHGLMLHAA
jgi:flagellum-specific peptidoglycan hydrolase FlgJ